MTASTATSAVLTRPGLIHDATIQINVGALGDVSILENGRPLPPHTVNKLALKARQRAKRPFGHYLTRRQKIGVLIGLAVLCVAGYEFTTAQQSAEEARAASWVAARTAGGNGAAPRAQDYELARRLVARGKHCGLTEQQTLDLLDSAGFLPSDPDRLYAVLDLGLKMRGC